MRFRKQKSLSPYRRAQVSVFALLSIIAVIIAATQQPEYTNILAGHDWSHLAGAKVTDQGVQVTPLNRAIIHQDGSKAQLNPPVNIRGPHLEVNGDFEISAQLKDAEDGASIQLYGEVPIIYDEWRQERPSMRIDASAGSVEVRVWDGTSSTPIDVDTYAVKLEDTTELILTHKEGNLMVTANGRILGDIPDHDVFKSGVIWFGMDGSDKGDGWTLESLKARAIDKGSLAVIAASPLYVDSPSDSLKNMAARLQRPIKMGAAVSNEPLFTDQRYKQIAMSQFNSLTPENSMKAQFIHPAKDKYTYTEADNIVDIARANNAVVHGHSLVFAKANPSWITDTSKEALPAVMTDHITNVVGHFKGKVDSWDVVNEPLSEKDEEYANENLGLRNHFWYKAMGEQYIDQAFNAARAADPDAKLYMNDYGIEHDDKRWDAFIALVQRLKSRGVPIDGVGFESHVYNKDSDEIDLAVMKSHMQAITDLGLIVRVSEIDVTGTDVEFQNRQYTGVLSLCISMPGCVSYTTWGISDLYGSTTVAERYPLLLGTSLLWDKDMKPKPAFTQLQNILNQNKKSQ